MAKIPKSSHVPEPKKRSKMQAEPALIRGGVMAWQFHAVDKSGAFSWFNLDDAALHKKVIEHLAAFETMDERTLGQQGSHFIDVGKLCKTAQDRLVELRLDDLDQVLSLRIMGKPRVYCVHRPNYMRVLWWDPEHQVCPSQKKHT